MRPAWVALVTLAACAKTEERPPAVVEVPVLASAAPAASAAEAPPPVDDDAGAPDAAPRLFASFDECVARCSGDGGRKVCVVTQRQAPGDRDPDSVIGVADGGFTFEPPHAVTPDELSCGDPQTACPEDTLTAHQATVSIHGVTRRWVVCVIPAEGAVDQ